MSGKEIQWPASLSHSFSLPVKVNVSLDGNGGVESQFIKRDRLSFVYIYLNLLPFLFIYFAIFGRILFLI